MLACGLALLTLRTWRATAAALEYLVSQAVDTADERLDLRSLEELFRMLIDCVCGDVTQLLDVFGRAGVGEVGSLCELDMVPVESDALLDFSASLRRASI